MSEHDPSCIRSHIIDAPGLCTCGTAPAMTTPEPVVPTHTGTNEPYQAVQPRIADRCPACGGQTLFIGAGGWLTCSVIGCKSPCHVDALAGLLARTAADAERRGMERAAGIVDAERDKWAPGTDGPSEWGSCAAHVSSAIRAEASK